MTHIKEKKISNISAMNYNATNDDNSKNNLKNQHF